MKLIKRLILLAILGGGGYYGWYTVMNDTSDKPVYRTEAISRGSIKALVSATGTLNPVQLITVGAQVSGKVNKLYVNLNDHVKAGQLLAEIDPALLLSQIKQDKSSLDNARVSYEQAERDLKRTQMLLAKDFVAKVDLEHAEQAELQAKNGYDAAKTTMERDDVNLNYAKITAPIDGVIIAQTVTEGQTLQSSFQAPDLFKIAGNLSEMKIEVNFSESDINKVKVGMPVTFTVNAFPERTFNGTVQTVNLNPSSQSGGGQGGVTYSVIIELKNEDGALLPGMTAYVSVILSEEKDVLRLPLAALRFNPPVQQVSALHKLFGNGQQKAASAIGNAPNENAKTIYVLKDDVLKPVWVTPGASDEAYTEVVSGDVNEGDNIVTGIQKVRKQ